MLRNVWTIEHMYDIDTLIFSTHIDGIPRKREKHETHLSRAHVGDVGGSGRALGVVRS